MLKLFKKSIWIPYEDSTVYPTVAKAQQAIIKYCEDNGFLYEFTAKIFDYEHNLILLAISL